MADDKLSIHLERRQDEHGDTFYIGKIKGPFTIDCKDGVAFLIFVSELDSEELQIANLTKPKKQWENNDR
jgi:hypothetical protein